MTIISARKLLQHDHNELMRNLAGDGLKVAFDDKVVMTNHKDLAASRLLWRIHTTWPKTPLLSTHLLTAHASSNGLQAGSPSSALTAVVGSAFEASASDYGNPAILADELHMLAYEITCEIYALATRQGAYVGSFDQYDISSILRDPQVKQAKLEAKPTAEGIEAVYTIIGERLKVLAKEGNQLAKIITSGMAKKQQAMQILGPRGFLTDIKSVMYTIPVMEGFGDGLSSALSWLFETRSASKALAHTTTPLQLSEYLSRQVQQICMQIRRLHRGDCGSIQYLEWYVSDKQTLGGILQHACDLTSLDGKYYLDESTGALKCVSVNDRHLIGQTIKLRSHYAGCLHRDLYGICSTCFGEASIGIPADTGIGQHCAAALMEQITQKVISTKHHDGSAAILGINFKPGECPTLWAAENGNEYYINLSVYKNCAKVLLVLSNSGDGNHIAGLTDMHRCSIVNQLDITRVSEVSDLLLHVVDSDGLVSEHLHNVTLNGRVPSITHAALSYIKEHDYTVDASGRYVVDFTQWDATKPLLRLPLRHANMGDLRVNTEYILTGEVRGADEDEVDVGVKTKKARRGAAPQISPEQLLRQLSDAVSAHVTVPIAYLETVLLAHTSAVKNAEVLARPPKAGEGRTKLTMRELYALRSLGPAFGWERTTDFLIGPGQYLRPSKNRPDHVMDALFMPNEVLKSRDKHRYKKVCAWPCCQDEVIEV
jgi:hypothetical protein